MHGDDPFVIVGAGLAGATAAQTLREEGCTGKVVLIGTKPTPLMSGRRCPRTT